MSDIPFGKHEGKTIYEIAEEDLSYLRWLVDQDWFEEKFPDLHSEVEEELEERGWGR